jgi:hypothetical protein
VITDQVWNYFIYYFQHFQVRLVDKKNWDTQNLLRLYQALNCQNKVKIKLTFTELQKHVIRQRLGEGITIRATANELNVSKNTVLLAK